MQRLVASIVIAVLLSLPGRLSAHVYHPYGDWRAATANSLEGLRLDTSMITHGGARIAALVPVIIPGRSIAGIRVGETFSALKRSSGPNGGVSISDEGIIVPGEHRWEWSVEASTPYLDHQGNRIVQDVWLSSPSGSTRSLTTHKRPPSGARVTRIDSVSSAEVTPKGIGSGSRLAATRRAYPHGHLLVFGGPIAWLVDGPGRRRTAFTLFRGVVQSVEIGCPQTNPRERGAPIDDAALC
jgi:hypothetical protein